MIGSLPSSEAAALSIWVMRSGVSSPAFSSSIFASHSAPTGTDPTGCDDFTFDLDVLPDPFIDRANGDLHMIGDSPLVDAGDPTDPGSGAIDFHGDPRAVDATPECSGNVDRRDIGADEFAPEMPDCDPPETTITKKPPRKTRKKQVTFEFEADEPATFRCKLDDNSYKDCESPLELMAKPGRHVFRVHATDEAGNPDASPAKAKFKRKR